MNRVIIVLSLLLAIACEKETELDIPTPQTKYIVNAIFEANKPAKVFVGTSTYVLDTTSNSISNAIVLVGTSKQSYNDTLQYADSGFYLSQRTFCNPNTSYFIKVEIENTITETFLTIPAPVSFTDYSFNQNAGINKSGFSNKQLNINLSDNLNEQNFYMLLLESHSTNGTIDQFQEYISTNEWYSYSPVIIAEGSDESKVFSDKLFNGQTIAIPMNFHLWNYDEFYDLDYMLKCYLISLSKEYYEYYKSLEQYSAAIENIWLVNSPPKLYSNVEGAFGVAAGINLSDSIIISF